MGTLAGVVGVNVEYRKREGGGVAGREGVGGVRVGAGGMIRVGGGGRRGLWEVRGPAGLLQGGAEEGAETGLLEVAVGGEGVGEALALHDGEGDAVGEAPVLVGA